MTMIVVWVSKRNDPPVLFILVKREDSFSCVYFLMGDPSKSCSLVVAHSFLQSGKHSFLVFCPSTLGLVHSYMHLLKHASKAGSFLVPLDASESAANAGSAALAAAAAATEKKAEREIPADDSS